MIAIYTTGLFQTLLERPVYIRIRKETSFGSIGVEFEFEFDGQNQKVIFACNPSFRK